MTTFLLRFRAKPGIDALKAVRAFLKTALRRFGLVCIEAKVETSE